jgi:hypothetical protein
LSLDLLAMERHSLRPQPLLAAAVLYLFCSPQSEILFLRAKTSMADDRGLRSPRLCVARICLSAICYFFSEKKTWGRKKENFESHLHSTTARRWSMCNLKHRLT